jgi:predicted glutamine amidotransferase
LVSIAHIRKATRGVVALENCHPFSRSWGAQTWVFAHNGDLQGAIPLGDRYLPDGSTDSEAAFCWILEQLHSSGVDSSNAAAVFEQLHHCAAQLAERGTFNALITTDEHWQPFQAGESLLFCAGEVIQRSRHGVRPVPISASSQPAATAQTSAR